MKSRDKLGINTGEYGIRSNNAEGNVQISEGNILAVGDSFTAGSEVGDTESWPAHLEKLLKKPVYNAAAGGWGPDQIVLRAEDLSEKIKPELIIISFMDQLIPRASYSVYGGGSKPYYTIQNEELIEHNIPVVPYSELGSGANLNFFKAIFGYSSFVNKVITATPWSNRWWDPRVFKKNEVDEVLISCLLLERIHKSSKPKNIKIIKVMENQKFEY
jgi:hypothetical protein